jgi:CheY-like chemotaxis protein
MTQTEGPSLSTARLDVLVVEDNRDARESLRMLLAVLGHHVTVAADGMEGVEKGVASRPQLALVDIGLPRLDGFEVARRLRTALGRSVLIVAETGYKDPDYYARAADAGFDGYLVKPIDFNDLRGWLEMGRTLREQGLPE